MAKRRKETKLAVTVSLLLRPASVASDTVDSQQVELDRGVKLWFYDVVVVLHYQATCVSASH